VVVVVVVVVAAAAAAEALLISLMGHYNPCESLVSNWCSVEDLRF
jgi:ribosomal protein S16